MSVDMDVVGVMAAYLSVVRVCSALSREGLCVCSALSKECSLDSAVHTRTIGKYAAITPTTSIPTDTIEPLLQTINQFFMSATFITANNWTTCFD